MNVISQNAFAKIAVNKSLLREYASSKSQRTVYLNDGDEFQIQLFNPETHIIGAKISLNGEELSDTLVIRPGERIWLERYFNQAKKFKFSTYEIEDSVEAKNAASFNGKVKIEFYNIKSSKTYNGITITTSPFNTIVDYPFNISRESPYEISKVYCNTNTADDGINVYYSTNISDSISGKLGTQTIETGRAEKGSYSDQKFSYVDYDFEVFPFKTETISILPVSRKPVTSSDLHKRYCSNCGRKLSPKHKYCPYCGTKID